MTISSAQQPRQEYGFGSFVKKITRPIKKIAKSPLGKAALIGGLGSWGLGMGPLKGLGRFRMDEEYTFLVWKNRKIW
jgi:hypothetical protein